MKLVYFEISNAVKTHDAILNKSGGSAGVLNLGQLDSILTHIRNDDYYPTLEEKLTHLVFAVNKSHCFVDGNKRTSIALGAFLLEVNGLDVFVSKFIIEMENIAVYVAENRVDKNLLREIICSLINEEEYSESLKLKIIHVLQK